MAKAFEELERSWDWLRVGAWSGSVAAHFGILLLIALPVTAPVLRPQAETLIARWIETVPPPPTLPEPPPPSVPHPVRANPVRSQHATPVQTTPVDVPAPTVPVEDATPITDATASEPATPANDIGAGGATQTLAYATPLNPRYPPASIRAHEQGTVLLRVLVDEGGVPQRVEIARSSGHTRLDTAARESVMHARFRPVMRGGAAAAAWGIVPIEFRLDRG
jgi:periplasmic protein TonB